MAVCERKRSPRRKICGGDLRNVIEIQERAIGTPAPGNVDAPITFTTVATDRASIETTRGTRRFSGVNIDPNTTHIFTTRRNPNASLEAAGNQFVLFEGRRFRIIRLTIDNEDPYFMMYECTERGDETAAASEA